MKIICKWIFITGKDNRIMKAKYKPGIENMNSNELTDLIKDLLSKNETIRVIFEKEKK